jgi:hypothetical protein
MLTIGANELGQEIEDVYCPNYGQVHQIEYGTSKKLLADGSWSEPVASKTLGFYKCGETLYFASLNGRDITNR